MCYCKSAMAACHKVIPLCSQGLEDLNKLSLFRKSYVHLTCLGYTELLQCIHGMLKWGTQVRTWQLLSHSVTLSACQPGVSWSCFPCYSLLLNNNKFIYTISHSILLCKTCSNLSVIQNKRGKFYLFTFLNNLCKICWSDIITKCFYLFFSESLFSSQTTSYLAHLREMLEYVVHACKDMCAVLFEWQPSNCQSPHAMWRATIKYKKSEENLTASLKRIACDAGTICGRSFVWSKYHLGSIQNVHLKSKSWVL